MPRSSRARTSVGSVYRAGGWSSGRRARGRQRDAPGPPRACGRHALLVVVRRLVLARLVGGEEAAERDHGARRAELDVFAVGARRADSQRHRLAARVLHLGGERALPHEVVERVLVATELAAELVGRPERVARGPDRLVRLLRVRDGAPVEPRLRRYELVAEQLARLRARRLERRLGECGRVGAHVGDVARFVEALRDPHRRLRREPQLPARLLLERRRPKRRRGLSPVRSILDRADSEGRSSSLLASELAPSSSSRTTRSRGARRSSGRSPFPARPACRPPRRAEPRTRPGRRSRGDPSTPRSGRPCARARAPRRAASRPTAPCPPKVAASPSSTAPGTPRSRTAGRGCGASPARPRAGRRSLSCRRARA